MILLELLANLLSLLIGLALISGALRDKRLGFYPKWIWIGEIIGGIIISLYGFAVWFIV
jgi:hypothetical protein